MGKLLRLPVTVDVPQYDGPPAAPNPRSSGIESGTTHSLDDARARHPASQFGGGSAESSSLGARINQVRESIAYARAVMGAAESELDPWRDKALELFTRGAGFMRERVDGEYDVDDFGFDPHLADGVLLPTIRPLYNNWFRVSTTGIENLPVEGGALLVVNHAGTIPIDGFMLAVGVHDNHPTQRHLRLLAADLVFETPMIGGLARKIGATLACNDDAQALLDRGHLVGVFPEGFKGVGKPFKERYRLQRFGRGGFVTAAIRSGVPIIPVSIIGSEEIYPMVYNAKAIARLFGFPYMPVTPFFPALGPLGAIPIPSKWHIEFGTPIPTTEYSAADADDPMVIFEVTDQVRETIQKTLYRLLSLRKNIFQDR